MISTHVENLPLFLVGFMASGKTAVGAHLASMLLRPFVDLDHEIERAWGSSIADLIGISGEPEFRRLESAALRNASELANPVVATGGGVVLDSANRRLMAARGVIIWLDVPFEVCWHRILCDGISRPLAPNRETAFGRYTDRLDFYREAALRVYINAEMTIAQVATGIADLLVADAEKSKN
ncbi:MAG: shikimate kinase [Acidobacteriota bacterium]